uniref:4Fe-4S dicluster domain-containing protein n=1 Tax=Thermofilum pendens TaxID=2269 RepID=A0A7C1NZV8_THEPE
MPASSSTCHIERVVLEHLSSNWYENLSNTLKVIAVAAERADGVIVVGPPRAADLWASILGELASVGARWPRIILVDSERDCALASLSLEELLSIWEEYLGEASRYTLHVDLRLDARVSRRDVLTRGLSSALRYLALVDVDSSRCAGLQSCALCLQSCPYSALKGKPPGADREKCVECGLCASSCPSGLLFQPAAPPSAVRKLIDAAASKGIRSLAVTCPWGRSSVYSALSSSGRVLVLELPCIASLRLHELLYARLRGLSASFHCALGEKCSRWAAAKTHLELSKEVEESFGPPRGDWSGAPFELPRLAALFAVKPRTAPTRLPLFHLSVSEACTLCGACANLCPASALRLSRNDYSTSLLFNSSLCVGCSTCAEKCPEKAITLSRRLQVVDSFEVVAGSDVVHCKQCGAPLGPLSKLRSLEKRMREKGFDEETIQSLYLCEKCKHEKLLRELVGSVS